jgi:hypothetical protein
MDRSRSIVATLVPVLLVCGLARPGASETFGTATEIAHVVTAAEFAPSSSNDSWVLGANLIATTGSIVRTGSSGPFFVAGLRLPAGAVVTRLEVAGCDHDGSAQLLFMLFRSTVPPETGAERVTPVGATGTIPTPGCGRFSVTPSAPPLVIDNENASYWIGVQTETLSTYFDSVRVYYQLRVGPAPATASFGDVPPSHPFFQFVEALVASGITAGCGGGNYCPDSALTRGQMAVFLSKALGLHFAP